MALKSSKFAAATGVAAALSMLASPVQARGGWGGWGGGWHRDRVDVGDVIAGVLILGTVAAIADAATRSSRDRNDRRYPGRYPGNDDDVGYRSPQSSDRVGGSGIDRAVDMCVAEVERGRDRVGSVDNVARDRDGWRVSGQAQGGAGFECRIGNDGRVRDVNMSGAYNGAGYGAPAEERADDSQWDDATYARARTNQVPPLPQGASQGDGRYTTSAAPDFEQGS